MIPNAIDFIDSICRILPSHPGSTALLTSLVQSIIQSTNSVLSQFLPQLLQLCSRAAVEKSIDPCFMLRRLDLLLRTTDVCSKGDWGLGMALLDCCAALLGTHPTELLLRPLGNLLYVVYSAYNDLDVRDTGNNIMIKGRAA